MSDPSARFRKGMEMLADPRDAAQWREGVGLVDSAAAEGDADAIERRALFESMGVARQPDWDKAVDSLAQAAKLGSTTAARQLDLLTERRVNEPPPAQRTISGNPLIRAIDGFISTAECGWLIAAAEPRLERAIVYSTTTGEQGLDLGAPTSSPYSTWSNSTA